MYLNPTPQGFWDRDTLPGLSTYIDHSLTCLLLITVSDWHRPQLHCSDDADVSEPHPSRFLGQRHSPRTVYLHRSLTHSLSSYNCFRLAQTISYIPVMMQVYLNPTPQGFWDRDTLPGLSTYIDHSLTHLLLITVSDWH